MPPTDRRSRRTLLCALASGVGTTLVAGCTEGMGDGEADPEPDRDDADADDADPPDTGWEDEWEDVETIELEAHADDGWIGRRPASIDGVENPDIALYEDREYEFVWTNTDGDVHNFAIWDDEDEPLVSTSFVEEEDEEITADITASEEMAVYLCETHEREMEGSIEIRTE
ncbi:uncharacterized protein Nmag_3800 (plasmid) [Natrialba magadii ATCC 43099]|uniref:Blue (type 1) copper domain-containing protein n=1 Tax=Natrialba magadii (strain ATCC 43099 / DSM 3394 / CCM 3739 / CIP 104546 / IAM 13178 / JCM 8861 / NBRC 102185 / NCIMB 2190 / MS3) TaxID=547559 RepID=D3T182_NATMM|nr:hypothetical protein [Natrialba magadii]ADD07341.1 uncharacterized protein Nmag_3800 [Natrialba magadii ATCC 43099]ELY32597.1 hypothetical protein C500_03699 [Natrialba magadii ATCC 43099]